MKIFFIFLLFISVLGNGWVFAESTQSYQSEFGFNTNITDNWIVLTRKTVSNSPELLSFDDDDLKNIDSDLISQVKKMALAGKIELLYYTESDTDFYDNINLFVEGDKTASLKKRASVVCPGLEKQIEQAFNRPGMAGIKYCKYEKIGKTKTLSYAFDGAIKGTTSYGYYFNTKISTITLTATCKNSKCSDIKKETEILLSNIILE